MLTKFKTQPVQVIARLLSAILILSFLFASLAISAQQVSAATCSKKYTVQSGDTLTKIANDNGVTLSALADANDLKDPYPIFIGQSLCIPGSTSSTATATASSSSGKSSSKKVDFTINDLGKRIEVVVTASPAKSVYYVRVARKARPADIAWTKVGVMRVNKEGEGSRTFRLTDRLADDSVLTVCLKNARNDDVFCKNFYRPDQQ